MMASKWAGFIQYGYPFWKRKLKKDGGFYLTFLSLILLIAPVFYHLGIRGKNSSLSVQEATLPTYRTLKLGHIKINAAKLDIPRSAMNVSPKIPMERVPGLQHGAKISRGPFQGSIVDIMAFHAHGEDADSAIGRLLQKKSIGGEIDQEIAKAEQHLEPTANP